MINRKSQFDLYLEDWARKNEIENVIKNKDVFVVVDKYNKPLDSKHIPKDGLQKLSTEQKQKLEAIKGNLPHENPYFSIIYDKQNSVFLIRKKTPVQNMLNVWAVVMIAWALYRWYFQTSLPIWFDEFISKPLVFITPIYFFITKIEKKDFLKNLTLDKPLSGKSLMSGIIIGIVFFVTGFASFFIKQQDISTIISQLTTPIWLIVLVSIATAVSEEILSRGFVLKRLFEDSKNVYTSAFFASILFFFMHIPIFFTNNNIVGTALLQIMATDFLFSFAVSFLYIQSRNLYLPILIHALYNISIYLFSTSK